MKIIIAQFKFLLCRLFCAFLFAALLDGAFAVPAYAAGATLLFSPASGTFFVGSTFNVSLVLDTGGLPINAVEVNVKFPPDKLQVASPSTGSSFISIWVTQPSYSNTEGTMTFRGGVPSPGITTSNGIITTITLRARGSGEAELAYAVSSQVLANDGKGTNVLSSRGTARFLLAIPPPEGPEVFSPTHPNPNLWYQNPNPTFFWKKESLVTDFSYTVDEDPFGVPDEISEGPNTSATFSNLDDGIWYFHLKARSDGSWGGATNFLFRIDRSPPAEFSPEQTPKGTLAPGTQPVLSFLTTDGASGVDHYEVKIVKTSGTRGPEEISFFTEASSPYPVPVREEGAYQVIVRAFDRAGNTRDATHRVEIAREVPKLFNAEGIYIRGILVRWFIILLLLGLLLILLLIVTWALRHRHRLKEEVLRADVAKIEAKLLEDYQKLYAARTIPRLATPGTPNPQLSSGPLPENLVRYEKTSPPPRDAEMPLPPDAPSSPTA